MSYSIILTDVQSKLIKSELWYSRYCRFLKWCEQRKPLEGELHHIVPKCIGGTDCKENLILLGYREHYLAHYILIKTFESYKLLFAFTNMQRVCGGKSILYPYVRKEIGKAISKMNKGLKRTAEVKNNMSLSRKGTVLVKNKGTDGPIFRVKKTDQRYISGELVFYRTGRKHTELTKNKMSKSSISGKKVYHRDSEIRYFCYDEDTSGFTKGLPTDTIEKHLKNLRKPRKLKLRTCPHCGLSGKGGNMSRSHFNNCKHKHVN
jgi:hypothetical protein